LTYAVIAKVTAAAAASIETMAVNELMTFPSASSGDAVTGSFRAINGGATY
jgi:hypothetical protein